MDWSILLAFLLFLTVEAGFLKDILNCPKTVVQPTTTSPSIIDRQEIHHNEQDYLADNVDGPIKVVKATEVGMGPGPGKPVIFNMKENQQGVYEFNVKRNTKCKFYIESRQQKRSLQCNERRCQLNNSNSWECSDVQCTISEADKKASCKDGGKGKEIFGRVPDLPCPDGQKRGNGGECRDPFE